MSEKIKKIYRDAGFKKLPFKGKGIHKVAFHKLAVKIKKNNPQYTWQQCFATAMKQLGRNRAVRKKHWR